MSNASQSRSGFTFIPTAASVDRTGRAIEIGDCIVDTQSQGVGGVVVAVAGEAIVFERISNDDGIDFDYGNAGDTVVVAKGRTVAPRPPHPAQYITAASIDTEGKPIRVGDRIEQLNAEETAGIVVGVFGDVLVHCLDFEGSGFERGEFLYANCNECRVMAPVTDVAATVLAIRTKAKQAKAATVEA